MLTFLTFENILFVSITLLLIIGTYTDIKTRTVSNKITGLILLCSISLIHANISNIGFFHFAYLGVFYWGYLRGLGGADLKAMFPLIFAVPNVMIFTGIVGVIGVLYICADYLKHKEISWDQVSIPFFIPITIGFVVVVMGG